MQENKRQEFKGIIINKILPINSNDEKGFTYEWCKGLPGLQTSIYIRNPTFLCGNHYHKGKDPSKNPERFFLIEGKTLLLAKNPANQMLEEIIEGGTELIIYPNVLHELRPTTKIYFIEYRSTPFNKENPDTYPAETYDDYLNFLKSNPPQSQSLFLHQI